MAIALGSDHAGFDLKQEILAFLNNLGQSALDCGAFSRDPVDYPDFAAAVGRKVVSSEADRGIVICGSGVGASVAANKIAGVRAGLCHDHYSAHQGVEHDDMNVLVLGSRVVGVEVAKELVQSFLEARFSNAERHIRRLKKVLALESSFGQISAAPLS